MITNGRRIGSGSMFYLLPETTSNPRTTVPGLTFRRPESRITSDNNSGVSARSQRKPGDKVSHGGDMPGVRGVVEHL